MKRYVLIATVVGMGIALAGTREEKAAARNPAAEWGTIKGQVVWGGDQIPVRKPIDGVEKNQDKMACLAKGPLLSEEWVVNKDNKGVQWTFVWLAPNPGGSKLPVHPNLQTIKDKDVSIDQPHCQFVPHAVALREGQNLVAKNSAQINHNVKWTGGLKNPGGNVILPPGKSHTIANLLTDKYPVNIECNIHPWMKAVARVYDHPYFAVTDASGQFEIKDAPAGDYRLVIWHDAMGYRGGAKGRDGTPVTIKPGTTTDLGKFDLKP